MMKVTLPDAVDVCGLCKGWGAYDEGYREGNFAALCSSCHGAQLVYGSGQPVGESVRQQVAHANGMVLRRTTVLGSGSRGVSHLLAYEEDPGDDWGSGHAHVPRKPCWELPPWHEGEHR